MKKTVVLQYILCSLLLFASIFITFRSENNTSQAGTFSDTFVMNDTFEHLTGFVFKELFG